MLTFLLVAAAQPEIFVQNSHGSFASRVAFSADSQLIVTTSVHEVKIWSASTGMLLDDLTSKIQPMQLEMIGDRLRAVGWGGIEVFNLKTRQSESVDLTPQATYNYVDSPNGKWRVRENENDSHALNLVNRTTGAAQGLTYSHYKTGWVAGDSGLYLAEQKALIFRSFADTNVWETFAIEAGDRPTAPALSADQKQLAVSCAKRICIYDTATRQRIKTLDVDMGFGTLVFSPDGKRLAGISQDVHVIDIEQGDIVFSLRRRSAPTHHAHFSPDSKSIVAWRDYSGGIVQWDVQSGKLAGRVSKFGHWPSFSPDGRHILAMEQSTPVLYDARTRQEVKRYEDVTGHTTDVRYSPDGRYFIVTSMYDEAVVWSLETGKKMKTLDRGIVFRFFGDELAVASWKGHRRYDLKTGKPKGAFRSFRFDDQAAVMGIHEDGKSVFVRADDTYQIIDIATGKMRERVSDDAVCAGLLPFLLDTRCGDGPLDKSADGRFTASRTGDLLTLADATTGKAVVSMLALDHDEYITFTPDSFYVASRGALSAVTFRVGGEIFPFEQFDLRLNRPDIVMQRIGYASSDTIRTLKHAYDKRLKKMGFTEAMLSDDFHLPKARIVSHKIAGGVAALDLQATDSKYKLVRMHVLVNGVPVYGARGTEPSAKMAVPLQDGRNQIQVSVLNEHGVESLKDSLIVHHKGSKGQRYVVSVGVSSYANKDYNLRYAAKDAGDVATALGGTTIKLLDGEATKEKIAAVKQLLQQTKPDDEVVVFVAGHGLLDDQLDYYFATADIDFDKPAARGLPYDEIEGLLDGIPARKKLLLMDTCHSGEVDKESTVVLGEKVVVANNFRGIKKQKSLQSSELSEGLFTDLRRGSGAMVIASSSGVELALESAELKNGVFTYALLDALKAGKKRMSELRDSVKKRVLELTHGLQTPTVRRDNLQIDFAL